MTWTYSRHIHLSVRHPRGRVWVDARCFGESRAWDIGAEAVDFLGVTLAESGGWNAQVSGSRAVAKKAMQDLAARLAAHIEQARGGA